MGDYSSGYDSNVIVAFDTHTKQWKTLGELNQARHGHAVIFHQGKFIVVGGEYESCGTESCTLQDDSVQCETVDPELENYFYYPEMMSVSENFCPIPKSWILVLNTFSSSNVPLLIDGKGRSKKIGFNFGSGTEVDYSCSIVWRGKMFVFGGRKYKRQISVVDDCQLTKKGKLPFNMTSGACAQRDNQEVFICFENYSDSSTWKNCHRSNGPLEAFSKLPSSTYDHRDTRIAVTSSKPNLVLNIVLLFRVPYRCW